MGVICKTGGERINKNMKRNIIHILLFSTLYISCGMRYNGLLIDIKTKPDVTTNARNEGGSYILFKNGEKKEIRKFVFRSQVANKKVQKVILKDGKKLLVTLNEINEIQTKNAFYRVSIEVTNIGYLVARVTKGEIDIYEGKDRIYNIEGSIAYINSAYYIKTKNTDLMYLGINCDYPEFRDFLKNSTDAIDYLETKRISDKISGNEYVKTQHLIKAILIYNNDMKEKINNL